MSIAKSKREIQKEYARRSGYAAQTKYDKNHTTRYQLKLNNETDKDIIEKLNTVPSKQGYIKECIRKDLEKEK